MNVKWNLGILAPIRNLQVLRGAGELMMGLRSIPLAKRGAYKLPDQNVVNVPMYWGYEGDVYVTRIERSFTAPRRDRKYPLSGYFVRAAPARPWVANHSYLHTYYRLCGRVVGPR